MPLLDSKSLKGNASTRSETKTNKKTQRKPKPRDRRQDRSDSEDEYSTAASNSSGSSDALTPIHRRRAATPPSTPPRRERSCVQDKFEKSRNSSARNPSTPPSTTPKPSKARYGRATPATPDASDSENKEEEEDIPITYHSGSSNITHSLPSPPITPPREPRSYYESPATHGSEAPLPALPFAPRQPNNTPLHRLCSGRTQKLKPCKRRVKVAGDRCHHHRDQVLDPVETRPTEALSSERIDENKCGGRTKTGTPCKNPSQSKYGGGCHHHPRQPGHDHQRQHVVTDPVVHSEEAGNRPNDNRIQNILIDREEEQWGRRSRGGSLPQRRPSRRDPPTQPKSPSPRQLRSSDWIPGYFQPETQTKLEKVITNGVNTDKPGHIYAFELKEPRRRGGGGNLNSELQDLLVKVGRSIDGPERVKSWKAHFKSQELVPLGYWPGTSQGIQKQSGYDSTHSSEEMVEPGPRGKYCHLRERLILLELSDAARNSVHLTPHFLGSSIAPGGNSMAYPSPFRPAQMPCPEGTCETNHRELFRLKRFESPEMRGREWECVVLPIIEKWERFVEEFGDQIPHA